MLNRVLPKQILQPTCNYNSASLMCRLMKYFLVYIKIVKTNKNEGHFFKFTALIAYISSKMSSNIYSTSAP